MDILVHLDYLDCQEGFLDHIIKVSSLAFKELSLPIKTFKNPKISLVSVLLR